MKRTRTVVALAAIALTLTTPAAQAAAPECDTEGSWTLTGLGSFETTSIVGELPTGPALTGGRNRIHELQMGCGSNEPGVLDPDPRFQIQIGKAFLFAGDAYVVARSGSQWTARGSVFVRSSLTGGTVLFEGQYELTVRDRTDIPYTSGLKPSDSVKVKIFPQGSFSQADGIPLVDSTNPPVAVIKGSVWGNKITSTVSV